MSHRINGTTIEEFSKVDTLDPRLGEDQFIVNLLSVKVNSG